MLDRIGVLSAVIAYTAWGFFPLYWQLLTHLSALEIMCHRVIWSFVFYFAVVWAVKKIPDLRQFLKTPKLLWQVSLASLFIAINWLLYVWSVTHGFVLESSLGYFMNPLMNVAIGSLVLREKLKNTQKVALLFAFFGVGWLTITAGKFPWIALGLAVSFASYGFVKKILQAPATVVSVAETLVLLPVAILVSILIRQWGPEASSSFLHTTQNLTGADWLLLTGGGAITGLPLLLFSVAAKRLPLSSLGFFQYLSPTFQFLSAVLFFHEPIDQKRMMGFLFIWMGLGIFLAGTVIRSRRKK